MKVFGIIIVLRGNYCIRGKYVHELVILWFSVSIQGIVYVNGCVLEIHGGLFCEHWPVVTSQMLLFVIKCVCFSSNVLMKK